MQILNEIFNQDEVNTFRNYWNNNWNEKSYVNWEIDGKVLDRRLKRQKNTRWLRALCIAIFEIQ